MTTNPYISNYTNTQEQNLVEGITIEIIQAVGQDCIYVPRDYFAIDKLFGEDPASAFTKAFTLEMYLLNYKSFDGSNNLLMNFSCEAYVIGTRIFKSLPPSGLS